MQQLSWESVCREWKHKTADIAPEAHLTPFASYCFLNSEVLSSKLQMGSKLMNKYEMSFHIISKDYIYLHVHIYNGMYVCVLSVAFSNYSFMLC